jgi:hypothetical protein
MDPGELLHVDVSLSQLTRVYLGFADGLRNPDVASLGACLYLPSSRLPFLLLISSLLLPLLPAWSLLLTS